MQKKDLLIFLKHINILKAAKLETSGIIYSPYIYNIIEGCKDKKEKKKSILYKALNITPKLYKETMSLPSSNQIVDIENYITLHKCIPEYKEHNILWIHKMYYSAYHMMYKNLTNKPHNIFSGKSINPNTLDITNIVIPLNLMIAECNNILDESSISLDFIIGNNLLLMVLSDFNDIINNKRKKEYEYDIIKINALLLRITQSGITPGQIWQLDFQQLIATNYEKSHLK